MINIFVYYAYLGAWTVSATVASGCDLLLEMSEARSGREGGVVSK